MSNLLIWKRVYAFFTLIAEVFPHTVSSARARTANSFGLDVVVGCCGGSLFFLFLLFSIASKLATTVLHSIFLLLAWLELKLLNSITSSSNIARLTCCSDSLTCCCLSLPPCAEPSSSVFFIFLIEMKLMMEEISRFLSPTSFLFQSHASFLQISFKFLCELVVCCYQIDRDIFSMKCFCHLARLGSAARFIGARRSRHGRTDI